MVKKSYSNARGRRSDNGAMVGFGRHIDHRNKRGLNTYAYQDTDQKYCRLLTKLNTWMGFYYRLFYPFFVYLLPIKSENISKIMGGSWFGIVPGGSFSIDLENSDHLDLSDSSRSITTWKEKNDGEYKNWKFLLTFVGEKGVAIELCSGTTIEWDGRIIRHCTSMLDLTKEARKKMTDARCKNSINRVFGYFLGVNLSMKQTINKVQTEVQTYITGG